MRESQGITMIELLVVVALAAILISATVVVAAPWLAREEMRSAVNEVNGYLQLARIEAVRRNHECRFVVDRNTSALRVLDTLGTSSLADDVVLHRRTLRGAVAFARPDIGEPVTLDQIGATPSYHTVFTADGMVDSGTGTVYLGGGGEFGSVSVYAAGGTELERWNGTSWQLGF